ncbi:MAG: TauD/TfdA family dioxygenase [Polyangiaceae bacterium]
MAEAAAWPASSKIDRTILGGLPVVVSPRETGAPLAGLSAETVSAIAREMRRAGGVLLRGFSVGELDAFRGFAASFGDPLLSYDFASTPRSALGSGVYTSTEYPPHQRIPLHNEQSYATTWPMKIWFYCAVASASGGETPIADSREVYRRIPEKIRSEFASRRLSYVRNYGTGFDLPWEEVFGTSDPRAVEAYCRVRGIACEWLSDGHLRTRQVCQAVAAHPTTREMVWFNQAHLFHVSALEEDVREALLDAIDEADLPRNVYYGDGGAIDPGSLAEIRRVLGEVEVSFPWKTGDVLVLDNMLTAHGRAPFRGERRVAVAMAEPYADVVVG